MFNKKLLTTAVCATALLGGTYSATTLAATADGTARAVVVNPLTLAQGLDMDFGTVTSGLSGGTVEIIAATSTAVLGGTAGHTGASTPATFNIVGTAGLTYLVTYTNGLLSDGAATMAINTFNDNATGTIPGGGLETFSVGGTLVVPLGQNPGTYSSAIVDGGTPFTVTVNYN